MRTLAWLFLLFVVAVAAWKEGRGSVVDALQAVIAERQHVAAQQELLDTEFAQCVR